MAGFGINFGAVTFGRRCIVYQKNMSILDTIGFVGYVDQS